MRKQRDIASQATHLFERQIMIPVLRAVIIIVVAERERQSSSPIVVLVLALRFPLFPSLLDHPGRSGQEVSSQESSTTKQQESS